MHEPMSVFKPTIESIHDDEAFLTQNPVDLIRTGDIVSPVPWMLGKLDS